jgi:hypothetical protein
VVAKISRWVSKISKWLGLDFEFSGFRNLKWVLEVADVDDVTRGGLDLQSLSGKTLNFFLHGTMWIEEFVGLMALKRDNRGEEAVPVMAERREREAEKQWRRERENGRNEFGGPSKGKKWDPQKN